MAAECAHRFRIERFGDLDAEYDLLRAFSARAFLPPDQTRVSAEAALST
jgi:hypothetical protein